MHFFKIRVGSLAFEMGSSALVIRFASQAAVGSLLFAVLVLSCNGLAFAQNKVPESGIQASEPPSKSGLSSKAKRPSFPGAKKVQLKPQVVKAINGKLKLEVQLNLPAGSKLNPLAPMGFLLETVNAKGPVDRSSPSKYQKINPPKETFELLVPASGEGTERLRLSMNFYHCQGDPAVGICKTGAVIWDIPFNVVTDSSSGSKDKVEVKYDIPKS